MKRDVTLRDLRIFGLIWSLIFAFLAHKSGKFPNLSALISLGFLLTAVIRPQLFSQIKIYQNWIKIGDFLGKINGFLISCILFYGIFTPTALVLKLLKKDPLHKKLNPSANSYFIDRKIQPNDMKNQF
jgi:hypothetical protein